MTLSIFSSNHVESLQQKLCLQLNETRLSNPLASEIVVVPTFAMARWLNLQIARQQGIAANFKYPLPAAWIWQLAGTILTGLPQHDPLQTDFSSWKIFGLLAEMQKRPAFATLQRYLSEDSKGIKRWQLATRIAVVFERYQHYRPELILRWSGGDGDDWQAQLWRELIVDHKKTHRVAVIERLIERLGLEIEAGILPERFSLFAHSSLPPLFIKVIHSLARHIDITLYQHSPTDQYWADLKSKKSLAKRRLDNPLQAQYFETGNDLLASWGRQGQALQDLLLDNDDLPASELEFYQAPQASTLLQNIQQSIFHLTDSAAMPKADTSLSVHVCHSPMRECQVLKDQLLNMLDRDPSLDPEDILVMIPEISRYAPYIETVFQYNENQNFPRLRWNLSDITLADEHPLILSFLQLLKLPGSRFGRSEVLSYLDIDEVRKRFDIDDQALIDIHSILEESRVRWGIDGGHKDSLQLPATSENTWHQAKQRIFAGYAFGDPGFLDSIAPIADVGTDRALNLSKFWLFFERLEYWRSLLKTPCGGGEWQGRLNRMLDDFFAQKSIVDDRLQTIRDVIDSLNLAGKVVISPALLTHWMEQQLATRESPGRLFSGGVTFCGMRPMRSLPFRVICLLGMNDGVFPRRDNHIEFDQMAGGWLPGDPSKGDEDRYLMLETLLCTRQSLYISYSGRSLKDNSECQPSVLVRELLDFIDSHYQAGSDSDNRFSDIVTTIHPMQAFAAGNFSASASGYDSYWCDIANRLQQTRVADTTAKWSNRKIAGRPQEDFSIDLNTLCRFLQDPIRFFFNRSLKLWLRSHQDDEDEEAFVLDSLDKWDIKQSIAENLIQGRETTAHQLAAQGRLPHGYAANAAFEAIRDDLEPLLIPLQDFHGLATKARSIDCQLDQNTLLSGRVERYYTGKGLMHFNASSLKGKHLLALWLDHLALCASEQYEAGDSNLLITRDSTLGFATLDTEKAVDQLRAYCELYIQGQAYPLPIFPLTSYSWACQNDSQRALKEARKAWFGNEFHSIPGDRDNAYVMLALRGSVQEPFNSVEFTSFAQMLYAGAFEAVVES